MLTVSDLEVGYTGPPERHAAIVASIPVAIVLLLVYVFFVGRNLRAHRLAEPSN